jgi:hypothetical protein
MIAIINLLTNILITSTSIIGCITIVNKIGKFCKVIEENNEDGFKIAFDTSMMDTIDDMNKCVESIGMIANNVNNIVFIMYDIFIGNKFIKKNKDGKIIIFNKSKVFSGYKDKIDELNNKVKKYQEELNKIKKPKKNIKKNNDSENSSLATSNSSSDNDNNSISSNSIDIISDNEEEITEKKNDDYYLET